MDVNWGVWGTGRLMKMLGDKGRLVKMVTTILVEETQHPPEMEIAW